MKENILKNNKEKTEKIIEQAKKDRHTLIVKKLSNTIDDKTTEKWLNYYNNYIKKAAENLNFYNKEIIKRKTISLSIKLFFALFIIILLIFSAQYLLKQKEISLGPPISSEIISNFSTWKYDDTNIDFPDSWTSNTYSDSSWKTGTAKLGFGTNDGTFGTTLQNLNQITFYFRTNFTIEDLSKIEELNLTIDYDDCYAIYINGNLLATSSNFLNNGHTTACSSVHNSAEDGSGAVSPIWPIITFTPEQISWLENGNGNIIAVEIHQQSTTSSDIVMMLNMQALIKTSDIQTLSINSPINNTIIADTTPLANFTLSYPAQVEYSLDSGITNITFCSSCDQGSFFLNLEEGLHTLTIYAKDIDNVLISNSTAFTIDMNSFFNDSYDDNSSIGSISNAQWQSGRIIFSPQIIQAISTLSFRHDGSSINTTYDSYLSQNNQNTNYGTSNVIIIDSLNPYANGLIKFPNIIGNQAGQIPTGAEILEANLTLYCTNPGNNQRAYLLLEDWVETSTTWLNRISGIPWASAGATPPSRDTSFYETFSCTSTGSKTFNATRFVQSWSSGANNFGIVIVPTSTDGVQYSTKEANQIARRPLLNVRYSINSYSDLTGNLISTYINTTENIERIDSISWIETNTNQENNITMQIFNGIDWQSISNGQSIENLNFANLAYRALFSAKSQTISLEEISIKWGKSIPDTFPPQINIISPESNYYNKNFILFSLSLNKEGDSCWYSINNQDNITMEKISQTNFQHLNNSISDGFYTALFFCNDTKGNLNSTKTDFIIDTILPLISFTSKTPQNATTITTDNFQVEVEIKEQNYNQTTFNLFNIDSLIQSSIIKDYKKFNLEKYSRIINNSQLTLSPDSSGVAYNPVTNTLFVIHNTVNSEKIDEIYLNGTLIRSIDINADFTDTEGIIYLNSSDNLHRFAVVEEGLNNLTIIFINNTQTSFAKAEGITYDLDLGNLANSGLEGITYDQRRDLFYAIREGAGTLMEVYRIDLSASPKTSTLFNATLAFESGLQSTTLTDLSDLYYDNNTDTLFILSHESQAIANVYLNGTIINNLSISHMVQPEGLTFDSDGSYLYVIGEPSYFSTFYIDTQTAFYHFFGIPDGTYFYNASTLDKAANLNSTETRTIIISASGASPPIVNLSYPLNNSIFRKGIINFECNASDDTGLKSIDLYMGRKNSIGKISFRHDGSSINTTYDSYLSQNNQNTNYGTSNVIIIDSLNPYANGLIKFPNIIGNQAGQIPTGAEILEANLTLYCTNPGNNQRAYLLLEDWVETSTTWLNRISGIPWASAGATPPSRDTSFYETFSCTSTGSKTFNATRFVQSWSSGANNFGIVIVPTSTNGVQYSTKEAALANRPLLTVTYRYNPVWHFNQTELVSGTKNSASFQLNLSSGEYEWNCLATDLGNNKVFANSNFTVTLNLTNVAPKINDISDIPFQSVTEGGISFVNFAVTLSDINGFEDLNIPALHAEFLKQGEETRTGNCTLSEIIDSETVIYNCSVGIQYWDSAGNWIVNVSVSDLSDQKISYNETFLLMESPCISLSSSTVQWDTLFPEEINKQAISPIIINNTCNKEAQLSVKAFDLFGELSPSDTIPALNFKINALADCPAGNQMINSSSVLISNSILLRGNNSAGQGIEELYICIEQVPDQLPAQQYSTSSSSIWEITLMFIALAIKKKKKSKQGIIKLIENKLNIRIEDLAVLNKKLKEDYNLSIDKILSNAETSSSEIKIPVEIFKEKIGASEALCKYLKENLNRKYTEIAKLINRDQRSIWVTYKNAKAKKKERIRIKSKNLIPLEIFSNRKLSILEALIIYLKEKGLRNIEISNMINKDPRNVYTFYSRAAKKINEK